MYWFYDPGLEQLLQEFDCLISADLHIEVRILLQMLVQPVDGLDPREAVVVRSHVSSRNGKERLC